MGGWRYTMPGPGERSVMMSSTRTITLHGMSTPCVFFSYTEKCICKQITNPSKIGGGGMYNDSSVRTLGIGVFIYIVFSQFKIKYFLQRNHCHVRATGK